MALADNGPAPYAPVKAVLTMVGLFRDKTLPLPVTTASIQRAGVEESLARRTLSGMKLLDLLDEEGNPTPSMQKIRVAGSDEYKAVLADWLRDAYKPVFLYVDPASDDVQRVTDQFRHYEPAGMRNRMVTLFLGLCVEAGLLEKVPAMPRSKGGNTASPKPKPTPKKPAKDAKADPKPESESGGSGADDQLDEMSSARSRYVDLLLAKAAESDDPPGELLDRIERALGIATAKGSSP